MQISGNIVEPIAVNVMDNLTPLCSCDFAMFPLPASRAVAALPLRIESRPMGTAAPFDGWIGGGSREGQCCIWSDGDISPPQLSANRLATAFLLVGEESITVSVEHLVMTHTQFFGRDWTLTVLASPSDDLATPAILRASVFLDTLVMHEAMATGSVFSSTSSNRAGLHSNYSITLDKALGNNRDTTK